MARKPCDGEAKEAISAERSAINVYLQNLRFKKRFFGIEEQDLWKKIAELNRLYEEELRAERIRYDTLLFEYQRKAKAAIRQYIEDSKTEKAEPDKTSESPEIVSEP